MSEYNRKEIINKAKTIKNNVSKTYSLGLTNRWCYYICKAIVEPKTNTFKGVKIDDCKYVKGSNISRQIFKSSYMDMAERIIRYVERENRMPTTVTFTTKKGKVYHINIDVCTDMFSRILTYHYNNGVYPRYANINSKCFDKPTETGNKVLDCWIKEIGFKPSCIDDVCNYILKNFTYEFYYDDQKSNEEVIKSRSGNCTDLSQMVVNIGDALDYDWKAIHTECRQSGTGHIYPMFRKDGGDWFTRDVACIADEGRYCVWCDVDNGGGYLLATNPAWFMENLHR